MNSFRILYELGCEVVHAIPRLYTDVELGNVRLYIGRTTKKTFLSNASYKIIKGYCGMVAIAICDMERAKEFEMFWQKLFFIQKKKKAPICVGGIDNLRAHGGGPEHDNEAVIYVAWRIVPYECEIGYPNADQRREIAREVLSIEKLAEVSPTKAILLKTLEAAKRLGSKQHLYWARLI